MAVPELLLPTIGSGPLLGAFLACSPQTEVESLMAITRRGFFGVLAAAVAAPAVKPEQTPLVVDEVYTATATSDLDGWQSFGQGMYVTVCCVCGDIIDMKDEHGDGWVIHHSAMFIQHPPSSGHWQLAHTNCAV